MILVSACLAGSACRYDGGKKSNARVAHLVQSGEAACFCPECAGKLPIPREPSEILGGTGEDVLLGRARVVSRNGEDVTAQFLCGAYLTLRFCREHGIQKAILKARSPSCGCGAIYDGAFTGTLRSGDGVACAMLKRAGIEVLTEEDLT